MKTPGDASATLVPAWRAAWRLSAMLLLALMLIAAPLHSPAQDTSFLSGEALATRLRQNLVWIAARDIGEHGYGLVVGGDAEHLWVATARHVVVKTAMPGLPAADTPSREIGLRLCTGSTAGFLPGTPVPGWDAGGADIALLSMPRPAGYELLTRALAPRVAVGDAVWLLGSSDDCNPVPAQGRVRALADASQTLRIDFPGVQGGSSGGPVLSDAGIVGLLRSAGDLTASVHAIADIERRVQALGNARWQLIDARNIAPTDPRAAQVDLAETLNQYLLALRDVHLLLQRTQVPRPQLDDFTQRYNLALQRFMRVREAHDGSLATHWPAPVAPAWRSLRESLWAVHLNFWRINPAMESIYRQQRTTPEVRAQMVALEPELQQLEKDMAQFLRLLAKEQ